MNTKPLPDSVYLKAVRIGIPFPRRSKVNAPTYVDLLGGLKIWCRRCDMKVAALANRYVVSIDVTLPAGVKFGNANGFAVNTRSAHKTINKKSAAENQCLTMTINLIYKCITKK